MTPTENTPQVNASEEQLQKARLMQERMVEAQRVIDLLAESSHGKVGTTEETLHVCSRLIEEAWGMSDELFSSDKPKTETDSMEKADTGQFYADDLVDQIGLGYSAVHDMLKRIHKEEDSDVQASLADVAMVLYKNAADRTERIISELEKKTGRIQVLIDIDKGYGGYDSPVMGFVIHPKQEASDA